MKPINPEQCQNLPNEPHKLEQDIGRPAVGQVNRDEVFRSVPTPATIGLNKMFVDGEVVYSMAAPLPDWPIPPRPASSEPLQ